MEKELLFSLGPKDFKWEFFKSSGPGGQNKNKRDTACRCIHEKSGAIGISSEEREQRKNRKTAFLRCIESDKFKAWHKLECAKIMASKELKKQVQKEVDAELNKSENILVEVKDSNGKWIKEGDNKT